MTMRAPANTPNFGQSETGTLGGDSPDVVVNGVFLSPRVIDRRAYGELAGELRDLVERSAAERSGLSAALDQAGRATQDFRQREQAQQGNIELTARALKTIDDRTAKIEALLAQVADQAKMFEAIDARAGSLIDQKIQVLEARLEAVTSGATAKTEALEERVRRASRELEQRIETIRRDAQSAAGPIQENLTNLCEKAKLLTGREPGAGGPAAPGSLHDLIARAEAMAGGVEDVSRRLEESAQLADRGRATVDEIARRQNEVERQASELGGEIERNLENVRYRLTQKQNDSITQAQSAMDEIDRRQSEVAFKVAELGGQVERNLEIVRSRLTQQQNEIIAQAQGALDGAQRFAASIQGGAEVAELRSVIQQTHDAHSTTSLAIKILNTSVEKAKGINEQLEPWRGLLDSHEPGRMPEPIRRMLEAVRGDLQRELSTIASALRGAAEKADRAGRSVGELSEPLPIQMPIPAQKASAVLKGAAAAGGGHPLVGARVVIPTIGPDSGERIGEIRRGRTGDAAD